MVLDEFKHDVALRRVWVEALIALFVVLLVENDLVLALSHLQIVCRTVHTQRVGLDTSRDASLGQCVRMDGDKEVGLIFISNVCARVQGNENIRLARIDDLHVAAIALYQPSEGQCDIQVDMLLLRDFSYGARIVASMSGINHQRKFLVGSNHRHCHHQHQYQ